MSEQQQQQQQQQQLTTHDVLLAGQQSFSEVYDELTNILERGRTEPDKEQESTQQSEVAEDDVSKLLRDFGIEDTAVKDGDASVVDIHRLNDETYLDELATRNPKLYRKAVQVANEARRIASDILKTVSTAQNVVQAMQQLPLQQQQQQEYPRSTGDPRLDRLYAMADVLQRELQTLNNQLQSPTSSTTTSTSQQQQQDDWLNLSGTTSDDSTTKALLQEIQKTQGIVRMLALQNAISQIEQEANRIRSEHIWKAIVDERNKQGIQQEAAARTAMVQKHLDEAAQKLNKFSAELNKRFNVPEDVQMELYNAAIKLMEDDVTMPAERIREQLWKSASEQEAAYWADQFVKKAAKTYSNILTKFKRQGLLGSGMAQPRTAPVAKKGTSTTTTTTTTKSPLDAASERFTNLYKSLESDMARLVPQNISEYLRDMGK